MTFEPNGAEHIGELLDIGDPLSEYGGYDPHLIHELASIVTGNAMPLELPPNSGVPRRYPKTIYREE